MCGISCVHTCMQYAHSTNLHLMWTFYDAYTTTVSDWFFSFDLLLSLCQIVKLLKIFYDMVTLDIFFIDFERPKYNTCGDHFTAFGGSHKSSHPGTPSIASSILKPPTSPANYECVSAWRNYFIANEWQELITKRKISLNLHLLAVIAFLMVRRAMFVCLEFASARKSCDIASRAVYIPNNTTQRSGSAAACQ